MLSIGERAQQRMNEHSKVKSLLRDGEKLTALITAQQALHEYGFHVGLLCDLAALQYEMGFLQEAASTSIIIQHEFAKSQTQLCKNSALRTAVFLSKILEEQGALAEALTYLDQAEAAIETPQDRQLVDIQQLRLQTYLGTSKDLSEKYLRLSQSKVESYFFHVEVVHGLMWAEWILFGFAQAHRRSESLRFLKLSPHDRCLIDRDFLEIALLEKQSAHPATKAAAERLSAVQKTSFDEFLLELFATGQVRGDYFFCPDLSKMQRLRMNRFEYHLLPEQRAENFKKFQYFMKGLSPSSEQLLAPWRTRLDQAELKLDLASQKVRVNGIEMKLTPQQSQIVSYFEPTPERSLEDLAHRLWQQPYDQSHHRRIRLLIHKVNRLFKKELGHEIFEFQKTSVALKTPYRVVGV